MSWWVVPTGTLLHLAVSWAAATHSGPHLPVCQGPGQERTGVFLKSGVRFLTGGTNPSEEGCIWHDSNHQLEEASALPGCGALPHHWYLAHSRWLLVLGQAKEQSAGDAEMGMKRGEEVDGNDLLQNFHFLAVSGLALSHLPKTCLLNTQF